MCGRAKEACDTAAFRRPRTSPEPERPSRRPGRRARPLREGWLRCGDDRGDRRPVGGGQDHHLPLVAQPARPGCGTVIAGGRYCSSASGGKGPSSCITDGAPPCDQGGRRPSGPAAAFAPGRGAARSGGPGRPSPGAVQPPPEGDRQGRPPGAGRGDAAEGRLPARRGRPVIWAPFLPEISPAGARDRGVREAGVRDLPGGAPAPAPARPDGARGLRRLQAANEPRIGPARPRGFPVTAARTRPPGARSRSSSSGAWPP